MFQDGFHRRQTKRFLRPFFQILAPLATPIETGARSELPFILQFLIAKSKLSQPIRVDSTLSQVGL